jgi:eukaryotic-like serine/threonine-protein kinase
VQNSDVPDSSSSEGVRVFDARAGRRREVGEVLDGKLKLGKLIGAGGMGTVYEAQDLATEEPVAVKLLHPFLAAGPGLARFRREAEAAANLRHENVVTVREFGVAEDGTAYIVMELLEGEDLRHVMGRGRLSAVQAAQTLVEATHGLAIAHRTGIVHRDLKPENIFVCRLDGDKLRAKILDFGIAKLPSGDRDSQHTATGVALGTPHYMAPEQARGAKNIDRRVDLYALGVILYEALSGRKPHRGSSYNAILFNILHTAPEPLRKLRPDLPGPLCDVVERAMAYAPDDRFASAEALIAALAPFADGTVDLAAVQTAPVTSPRVGLAGSEVTPAAVITGPVELPARDRLAARRWVMRGAVVSTLGLIAAFAWFGQKPVSRSRDDSPAPPPAASARATAPLAPAPVVATPVADLPSVTADAPPQRPPPRRPARRSSPGAIPLPPSPPGPTAAAPTPDIDRVNPYNDAQQR